ncbi:MAG: hypothetical protein DRO88_06675 [Promethearchaeia archaeon]|nr:MAG: hypothetical protein DRO88_06675 [Candidatus Lokiarchaeia archaeon]
MQASVAISYFHRKIGPIVYYSFPEDILTEDEKSRLAEFMDQIYEEGYFTHKFGKLASMNYYFEINSEWARGNKEMLMVSFVIDKTPNQMEEAIFKEFTREFAEKMKTQKNLFKAFYSTEDTQVSEADYPKIKEFNSNIRFWLKELYWTGVEELRERTEEEKWASIMSKKEIFNVIKKLSKGPISNEDLQKWFEVVFPNYSFEKIIEELQEQKFVFVNSIGQDSYVLLVKDVSIMRVPPNCVIDLEEEDSPEMSDLTEIYINEVRDFFETYSPSSMDSLELFTIFADSKKYNIITQLRQGPLAKDKILSLYSEDSSKELLENLEFLKQKNIIQDFSYAGEHLYLLKTDIVLTASFPEYLKGLLPKETKGYIARAYSYRSITSNSDDV